MSLDAGKSGMMQPVGEGDYASDVLRYWTEQVRAPAAIFGLAWTTQAHVKIESGNVGIYYNFTEFMRASVPPRPTPQPSDLQSQDMVNIEDVVGAADVLPREEEPALAREIKIPSTTEFWNMSRVFVAGLVVHKTNVVLPSRFAVRRCLERFASKVYMATAPLHAALEHVPTAYADTRFHRLHLLLSPSRGGDHNSVTYYNLTETRRLMPQSQVEVARVQDMATVHPMFGIECWRRLLFMVAGLSYLKHLYIHFRFDVGHYCQYVTIHEQCFEVDSECEAPYSVNQEAVGVHHLQLRQTLESQDCDDGTCAQWVCDLEIPDGPSADGSIPPISRHLPHFRGTRVRFVFRHDHSSWFF